MLAQPALQARLALHVGRAVAGRLNARLVQFQLHPDTEGRSGLRVGDVPPGGGMPAVDVLSRPPGPSWHRKERDGTAVDDNDRETQIQNTVNSVLARQQIHEIALIEVLQAMPRQSAIVKWRTGFEHELTNGPDNRGP